MNPLIRTIASAKDSVPHYTVVTAGTFTGSGRRLAYAGSDDLRLQLNKYVNVWLYFPVANLLVKVDSYSQNVVWLPLGINITLSSPEVGQVVEAVLVSYQLENTSGSAAATVNGQNLNAGFPLINGPVYNLNNLPRSMDPVIVDATNSSVRVVEQK